MRRSGGATRVRTNDVSGRGATGRTALTKNPPDEIEGIGPTRKRALLVHFGTAKSVARASVPDPMSAPGLSTRMAQTIYDLFHTGGE